MFLITLIFVAQLQQPTLTGVEISPDVRSSTSKSVVLDYEVTSTNRVVSPQ